MEIEVIEEKENPLLGRKELRVKVSHDGPAPNRDEVRKRIEAVLDAKKETVIVDTIKTEFGVSESLAVVKVYKSKEKAESVEPSYILERNKPPEKPEAEPAKEEKEEPAEEKGEPEEEAAEDDKKEEK
jgi:small subunit ribosomal protein S24e